MASDDERNKTHNMILEVLFWSSRALKVDCFNVHNNVLRQFRPNQAVRRKPKIRVRKGLKRLGSIDQRIRRVRNKKRTKNKK